MWPELPLSAWAETCTTLHLWTQVVGKICLVSTPKLNHWWNVALHINARGLTTPPMSHADITFDIQFDFLNHALEIATSNGGQQQFALEPQPVAVFYDRTMAALRSLGIAVDINTRPQEIPGAIPFERDYTHSSYDREYAARFWHLLAAVQPVFEEFRARFVGKCSPVHFFWGSFDLACTRFSGRPAPRRQGIISGEAYSHEVISAGFWPGGGAFDALFYAYTVPQPAALPETGVRPTAARWEKELAEFILPYEDARRAESPAAALTAFLESTYEAGAKLANWDRAALERQAAARTA